MSTISPAMARALGLAPTPVLRGPRDAQARAALALPIVSSLSDGVPKRRVADDPCPCTDEGFPSCW